MKILIPHQGCFAQMKIDQGAFAQVKMKLLSSLGAFVQVNTENQWLSCVKTRIHPGQWALFLVRMEYFLGKLA